MGFKVAETNILFSIGVNILDFQPKPNPQIEKTQLKRTALIGALFLFSFYQIQFKLQYARD